MKILRLSLNNLASLAGTHHIQFDDAPLAHAGLIAITGKTGAGKSTLLDAMCLALYNEVPRLSGAAGSLKDVGGQDISIKDSKNILRRGTTSGFAELEFIALDGKRYQARWEIRRARNKVDGNLKLERAITCLDDQCLLNHKISEATPIVEKLIGLSFEQFTRAVLLAQSEVGAFLKAKDHERADLLEYLTNSHIFSLVSIKAAEKYSEVSRKRTELEKYVGKLELLSDEQIEKLQSEFQASNLILENLSKTEKLLENELKWHKDRHELYANMQAKKEVYDVQLDADQKLQSQKQLLVYLDQFQPIQDAFNQQRNTQIQLNTFQESLKTFQPQLDQAQQNFNAQQQLFEQSQKQLTEWQNHREQLKPQLEQARQIDHEIHTQAELFKKTEADKNHLLKVDIAPLQQQITLQQQQFNQQQQALLEIEQNLSQTADWTVFDDVLPSTLQSLEHYQNLYVYLQQHYPMALQSSEADLILQQQEIQSQIETWQTTFKDLNTLEQDLNQNQKQQEKYAQDLHHLDNLKQHCQRWQHDVILLKNIQQDDVKNQQKNQQLNTQLNHQQTTLQQAELHLKNVKDIFEQQRLLQNQSVQDLRVQLQPDAPCMVCGSQTHPFVEHQALLQDALANLQHQQLEDAEQQVKLAQQQLNDLKIQISQLDSTLAQQQQRIDELNQQTTAQYQQISDMIQTHALSIVIDRPTDELNQTIQQNIDAIIQQQQQLKLQREQQETILLAWRNHLGQLEQLKIALQQRQQLSQIITPMMSPLPQHLQQKWRDQSLAQCQTALAELQLRQQGLNQRLDLQNQLKDLQQNLKAFEERLQFLQQREQQLDASMQEVLKKGKQLREQLNKLTETYAGQQYRKFADWQQALETQDHALQQQLHAQRQNVEQTQQRMQDFRLEQQRLHSQVQQHENALKHATDAIFVWKQQHPEFSDVFIEQCMVLSHQQVQSMRADLERHHHALSSAKSAWETLEEHYQKHLSQQPVLNFEMIQQKLIELAEQKSIQQNASNTIDAELRMNDHQKLTLAKYQSEIEVVKAEEYRWGRIYDLIGHKEGIKFKKIAQEHHLDILVEYANQQLQPLAPRYQLHRVPNSLSLAIIDLDMNSEVRPVLSLSGGETFLVSLALALAIANMASGSMKLESLFIDEGFGTLDPASLHMVMNALDHLQSQGRKVVLISHVQDMHERIPVQIQVKTLGSGASSIEVVG